VKLEPCPFCGSREIDIPEFAMGVAPAKYWVISCPSCGAEGPSGRTLAEAVEKWNRRKA